MSDLFIEPDNATPLGPDEKAGLKQSWITSRADLNAAEQDNIDKAVAWAFRNRRVEILTVDFATKLHRQMFGEVWAWAGAYRRTDLNIGVAPHRIAEEAALLFDDARFWAGNHSFEPDEIAVRLHHRLVFIHPFANGNGRHSRLMADLLIRRLGGAAFTWGGGAISDIGEIRRAYISALRAADANNYESLIAFARS